MDAFGETLRSALDRVGLTRAQFAAAVGVARSLVTDVIAGRRAPPMARVDAWAEVLGVPKTDRKHWRRLGALAHAHEEVQDWVAELERELAKRKEL